MPLPSPGVVLSTFKCLKEGIRHELIARGFPGMLVVKNPPANSGDKGSIPGLENMCTYMMNVEKAMAPHSSTLAWTIPWTEEPVRLQSMGSLRVGHD